jgi:hypothetical protein
MGTGSERDRMIDGTPLLDYMRAREAIRIAKEAGAPAPWTDDPILHEWSFCNVNREDDRVTRWIKTHWRDRLARDPMNVTSYMALARWINWVPTLERIDVRPYDRRLIKAALDEQAYCGQQVFTNAYIIYCEPGFRKIDYVLDRVDLLRVNMESFLNRAAQSDGFEKSNLALRELRGWGGFMSYEVTCDLRYTDVGKHWLDWDSFANNGPGANRGLQRLLGNAKYEQKLKEERALELMVELLVQARARLKWSWLNLRCIEHSLCEFDKYSRVVAGQGTPRKRYHHAHPLGQERQRALF